jgi:hypothetical protein
MTSSQRLHIKAAFEERQLFFFFFAIFFEVVVAAAFFFADFFFSNTLSQFDEYSGVGPERTIGPDIL